MGQNQPGKVKPNKKIKAQKKTGYTSKIPGGVYQVPSPTEVNKGETVEIKLDCENGFTVFIPNAGFFGDHVFQADDHTHWAANEPEPEFRWWGVSLTRTNMDNPKAQKELAYCIYSNDLDNFAVGNSPPKMILKP